MSIPPIMTAAAALQRSMVITASPAAMTVMRAAAVTAIMTAAADGSACAAAGRGGEAMDAAIFIYALYFSGVILWQYGLLTALRGSDQKPAF